MQKAKTISKIPLIVFAFFEDYWAMLTGVRSTNCVCAPAKPPFTGA